MKTRTLSAYKQKGFSLLTGFMLVIILFGSLAFFLAGSGLNAGFFSTYANSSKVSSLLTSAGDIKTGFDTVLLNGTVPASVTFDDTVDVGIFNATTGSTAVQSLDPSLFETAATDKYWIYRKNKILLPFGDLTLGDYSIIAAGLKKGICEQINLTLNGATTIPALTGVLATVFVTASVAGKPYFATESATALDESANATITKYNGCYQTTEVLPADIKYIYIHTLLVQ